MTFLLSTYLHVVLLLSRSVCICYRFVPYRYSVCWYSALYLSDEYGCVFFGEGWDGSGMRVGLGEVGVSMWCLAVYLLSSAFVTHDSLFLIFSCDKVKQYIGR